MEPTGLNEGIYSFGWYIRKFCLDAMEKGAIPIVMSITPRNFRGEDGRIVREKNYTEWAREAAEQVGAYFVDLNEISAAMLDRMDGEEADAQFCKDPVHSSLAGAHRNAASAARGLRSLKSLPVSRMMK